MDLKIINVINYGAKGDGIIDDSVILLNCINDIGKTNKQIFFPTGTYKISNNIVFPANIILRFAQDAMLSPDNEKIITINGEIKAELYQIFTGEGSVFLNKAQEVYTNWFGAKLDGKTDDTYALNKAAVSCVYGSSIITPYTSSGLYITDTIYLTSGIEWDFDNTSIFVESSVTAKNLFYTGSMDQDPLNDISLKKLKVYSTNDKNYWDGGTVPVTSNIYFFESNNGVINLTIEDICAENMLYGIKLDRKCENIELNNIEFTSTFNPIYMSDVKQLRGNDWMLGISPDAANGDHQIYFNGGVQDVKVLDVELIGNGGAEGACIIIQNSQLIQISNKDIYFDGLNMVNINKGIQVSVGDCININFTNLYGSGLTSPNYWVMLGWGISTGKVIDGVNISDFFFESAGGGLIIAEIDYNVYPSNVRFIHGTVRGQAGSNMIMPAGIKGLYLEDVIFTEGQAQDSDGKLISCGSAEGFDCIMDNCKIYYDTVAPSSPPIAVSGAGLNFLVVRDSFFINNNKSYALGLNWNTGSNSTILFDYNIYKGFDALKTNYDTKTLTKDNFNLTTGLPEYTITKTYNPASIAAGSQVTGTFALTGAALGDEVVATFSLNLAGVQLTAYVSSPNYVTCIFANHTANAIDLKSGIIKIKVIK